MIEVKKWLFGKPPLPPYTAQSYPIFSSVIQMGLLYQQVILGEDRWFLLRSRWCQFLRSENAAGFLWTPLFALFWLEAFLLMHWIGYSHPSPWDVIFALLVELYFVLLVAPSALVYLIQQLIIQFSKMSIDWIPAFYQKDTFIWRGEKVDCPSHEGRQFCLPDIPSR